MRHVLFDINALLDVLLKRNPFNRLSGLALSRVDGRLVQGYVSARAIPTIVYIADKKLASQGRQAENRDLVCSFENCRGGRSSRAQGLSEPDRRLRGRYDPCGC